MQIQHSELTRKISKAKSLLILDHPFFGTAVSKRPITITESVPTAAMSATGQMYINPEFAEPLTVRQLMFLLGHEAMHYMFCHSLRRQHRDPRAWNIAADKVINDTLVDARVGDFIEGGIYEDGAREFAAEQLYTTPQDDDDGDQDADGGIGCDIGDPKDDNGKALDEAQIHQLEAQAKIDTLQSAKAAKSVGKLPASIERMVDQLVNVSTPWHQILERFMQAKVKNDISWRRPNRRFIGRNIYLPGADYTPTMGTVVIAVDTSGSMGQRELTIMLSEVKAVCDTVKPNRIRLLYWGHTVVGDEVYGVDELDSLVKSTKPKGGGGTDVTCVTDYMTEHNISPQAALVLTDGYLYGGWGNWTCPVLWAIIDNEHANPTVGKRVHIKSGDM
jgi:predicted metal-dependent peptidase